MIWLLIAYLLALIYLAVHRNQLPPGQSLASAWRWFAAIPISRAILMILGSRHPIAAQVWADGFSWLFLGISFFFLAGIISQRNEEENRS